MATPRKKAAPAEPQTRVTYRVLRAFTHEGTYYAGRDVPEIGELDAETIQDRIDRKYIQEYRAHVPPAADEAPDAPPPPQE